MIFNFDLFKAIATKAYATVDKPAYLLDDVLEIFLCYFTRYEEEFGVPHPNISARQIKSFIEQMPAIAEGEDTVDINPECYRALIDRHFETEYRCDYNINHFFSGDIRLYRFYETLH